MIDQFDPKGCQKYEKAKINGCCISIEPIACSSLLALAAIPIAIAFYIIVQS